MANNPEIGVVGLGDFGRFAAAHLAQHFEVVAYDPAAPPGPILGVELAALATVATAEFVVLCVPVQRLQKVLGAIEPHLRKGACVADVGSVKMAPMGWLAELLPAHVDYFGTHPLFGPRSAEEGLEGNRIVVCPGRGDREDDVAEFLQEIGLYVIVTDPETHDRESARAQALAQYVGRALRTVESGEADITTYAADLLREVEAVVGDDSWKLFAAIQNLNPFAAEARAKLRASLDELEERLQSS
jgi:prephenate dehydrogenase